MTYSLVLASAAPTEGQTPSVDYGVDVNDSCNELYRLADDWTAVTPTVTSGLTVGNAVRSGFYRRTQGICQFYGSITFGSTTSSVGSPIVVSGIVPTSGESPSASYFAVSVVFRDASTGFYYDAQGEWIRTVGLSIQNRGGLGALSNTVPFVWATGDAIMWGGSVRLGRASSGAIK